MGNRLEEGIIGLYSTDTSVLFSINQISKKLKKAYPYINKKVNEFIDRGIFNKTVIGRSCLCSINLRSDMAVTLLSIHEINRKEKLLRSNKALSSVSRSLDAARQEFRIHCILFSGEKLVFVLDYLNDRDAILNRFPSAREFPAVFYDKESFIREIIADRAICREKTVLSGFECYFSLVEQAAGRLR